MNRPQAPRTRVALAMCLVLMVAAIAATLSRSPATVARGNQIETAEEIAAVTGHFADCQRNEILPQGTTAIRLSLDTVLGPRIKLRVLKGKQLLTSGERGAGWTAADVTVPVRPVAETTRGVAVCFEFSANDESVELAGEPARASHTAKSGPGVIKVEYLEPGHQTWWSLASSVAAHMGVGHAWSGSWIVPFLAAVMLVVLAIVSRSALRLER